MKNVTRVQFKKRETTKLIVLHCSATPPTMDVGLRLIRQWHLQNGWFDVGYHFIIRRNGELEEGRDHSVIGAHVEGHNFEALGICLVGGQDLLGKPEDNFTEAQWSALESLVHTASTEWYPGARICGHRDLDAGKACPSFDVATWLDSRPTH